jgi:hypothetical protein
VPRAGVLPHPAAVAGEAEETEEPRAASSSSFAAICCRFGPECSVTQVR